MMCSMAWRLGLVGLVSFLVAGEFIRAASRPAHDRCNNSTSIAERESRATVKLERDALDESAGGLPAFRIESPTATYFLEKSGAGLSSLVDRDGNDWLSFTPQPGSGAGGEYRGFPNAVHKESGSFFHPMNSGTQPSAISVVDESPTRISIAAESENKLWACRYDFYPSHATFTMTRMPPTRRYWVLYEGTPGGQFDDDDWWMTAAIKDPQPMTRNHDQDLIEPEWIAFGDKSLNRALLLLHHQDDHFPDYFYAMQHKMTVFGFGRSGLNKFLNAVPRQFSIGFVENRDHAAIHAVAMNLLRRNDSVDRKSEAVESQTVIQSDQAGKDRPSDRRWTFRVHEIGRPGGASFGQTSAVDVDRDGDLDFISGRQFGDVFWFENRGREKWVQHRIGQKARTDVGGVAFDVDGDGWIDQVSGGTWFRNPGKPRDAELWERFENGATPAHDNVAADMDGDGKLDLVSLLDKSGVFWYRIPADPRMNWVEHKILGVTTPECHGGIAVGDIDGDGDNDVARVDRWLENADGKGETWIERPLAEFGKVGPWGIQTRAQLVDVDRDGDLDLIQAEGDVLDGRVAWFLNLNGNGLAWERRIIRESGHNQDFHSLCVADFDNDGDIDVFSGGGPLTHGEHLWFLWENQDGHGKLWREHVIQRGMRTHESVCGDVDGDGDIDILTKPWRGDLHLFVENLLRSPTQSK